MALFQRTYNELIGEALSTLVQESRITRVSPGSKTRAILETICRQINDTYQIFDLNFARAFLSGATGKYLDFIGELMGVPRLGIETAEASAGSKTVKFFVETGTFGAINGGSPITVPAGETLFTVQDGTGIIYQLPVGVVLGAAATEQFVQVRALSPGTSSNVGNGQLQFHSFTNYIDSANGTLKVTNLSPILTGADIEDDVNYRFRLSRSVLASEAANETAITLAVLSTPGVANLVINNRANGIGTFEVLLKSITPTVSEALMDNVQANVQRVIAQGIIPYITRPFESGLTFEISVTYKNGVSSDEKDQIETEIINALTNYVNGLDIGEDFIINEAVERVMAVSPNIKDIGKPSKPFDKITLFRESKLEENKIKQKLISNFTPRVDERIIIEPGVEKPIVITRNN